MKHLGLLLLSFPVLLNDSVAQGIVVTPSAVGIHTSAPTGRLEVSGSGLGLYLNQATAQDLFMRYHVPSVTWWSVGAKANGDFWFSNSGTFTTDEPTPLVITKAGKIGVGTTAPGAQWEVVGGTLNTVSGGIVNIADFTSKTANTDRLQIKSLRSTDGTGWDSAATYLQRRVDVSDMGFVRFGNWDVSLGVGTTTSLRIAGDTGNVGIGTANPTHRLTVNGKVKSKGFVTDTSNWADYVFADDYQLPSLEAVESHIKEKRHLPGVPSQSELIANGLDLGEMSATQMAQIEQLMLHLIALNKQVQAQAATIEAQNSRLRQLESALPRQ